MPEPATNTASLDRTAARIAITAVVCGVVLRLWVLSQRGSLWIDEAALALNVLGRDFAGLLRPLDWGQAAPVGFLWLERALAGLLGPSEWVFRLWPAVAGAGTLWLVWRAGRGIVRPMSAALAVVVLAFSLLAIRYSAEAKPYASDAFVSVALVALALRVLDGAADARRWLALGVAGVGGVLMSLPSVFVLAAIGAALVRDASKQRVQIRAIAMACGATWLATFGALWILVIRESSGGEYLREYWAPVMLDARAGDFVARVVRAVASAVATPIQWTGSVALALAMTLTWLVGLAMVARRDWRHAVLLAGPFGIAAAASLVGVYPLSDRLAYFAAPLALLAAAEPLGAAVGALSVRIRRAAPGSIRVAASEALAWVAALALGAWVGMDSSRIMRAPGLLEPTHALFADLRVATRKDGTPVYLFARAIPAWTYATTDWSAPLDARFGRFLALAGSTEAPAHENLSRARPVRPREGDTLVYRERTNIELIGLAPGVRYRIAGPTSRDGPSPGWAAGEAQRIRTAANPAVWIVASHFFEGTPRDELRPLVAALQAEGLQVVEERRGGRDVVALRFKFAARAADSTLPEAGRVKRRDQRP